MKNIIIFCIIVNLIVFSVYATEEGHVNSNYYPSQTAPFDYSKLNDIIIFGDSYSTTDTDYDKLTYTGKNQSGGKNWPMYLLDMHDMYLWNFAYGGATMSTTYVIKRNAYPLNTQYDIFKSKMTEGKEFSHWKGESSLFTFWFGINDILKSVIQHEDTVKEGLKDLFTIINDSYNTGARNFLIFNVPPFDKSPQVINGAYRDIPEFIEAFNTGIKGKVEEFSKDHPSANVILYNAQDEFNFIWENHDRYNITEMKKEYDQYSHLNRDNFFWNNSNHPTTKVHQYFTEDLHHYLNTISINKVEITNTTIKAAANLMESSSLKKINNELNHSCFALIVFLFYFVFF